MSGPPPALTLQGVRVRMAAREILRGIDLTVAPGELVAILGASGAGKSTLLRVAALMLPPDEGSLHIAGEWAEGARLAALRSRVALIAPPFVLLPHLTLRENVALGLIGGERLDRGAAAAHADAALARVGLAGAADRYPRSEGPARCARVAIARALVQRPTILLFDEPSAALAPAVAAEICAVVASLAGEGIAMLLVSHESALVRQIAGRAVLLADGRLAAEGPAAAFLASEGDARRHLRDPDPAMFPRQPPPPR